MGRFLWRTARRFPGAIERSACSSASLSPSIKISPKKILHGVLNSGFPQSSRFPSRKFGVEGCGVCVSAKQ
ncbi:hypothetical protein ANA_P20004 (plasmid) [Anabaena sp. 90]|nr:hypothetical protein ANA_P20004 [Anabaena sp. 90]